MKQKIAVVGQGVMGLTSAFKLLDQGYKIDVFSREDFLETTSMAAGAYWWPTKIEPVERVSDWSKQTYDEYQKLSDDPESGIHFEKHFRFCLDPDSSAYARHLVSEWESIDGKEYGIDCHEAFLVTLPVIDVPTYMPYLKEKLEQKGANFILKNLESPDELFSKYDLVVNCSGVWAYHFVKDSHVYPIRGQNVRIALPDGGLRESTRLYQKEDQFTLVLPRQNDVILGGTTYEGDWDRTTRPEDSRKILERCSKLVPKIANCEVLGSGVGLRPGRHKVRLELEIKHPERPIVHNYGHGGGGYTVAWGCANEVNDLVEGYFHQLL